MANGGKIAQRGFIFQSIIAMIECLDRSDWDAIKVEPETVNDKVDIMFYRNGRILSAIQVKSKTLGLQKRYVFALSVNSLVRILLSAILK